MEELIKSLDDVFGKKAPQLPKGAKEFLVSIAPWAALIGGILSLLSVYWMWHWAHLANNLVNYANQISQAYGGPAVGDRLTIAVWVGMLFLLVEGIIYLAAFSGLKARKLSGWTLLFYGVLVNIAYGIVMIFTSYGGVGRFIGALIGAALGFWLLFQVRHYYK